MVSTYPLRVVFPGVPGIKRLTDPSVNPSTNTADLPVARHESRQNKNDTTEAPQRSFAPHTPSDDAYHLGRMIYTL